MICFLSLFCVQLTQIVRQLLPDVQSKEPLSGSSAADSSDTAPSTATIKFGRGMPLGADLDPLKDLTEIDLNKVSEVRSCMYLYYGGSLRIHNSNSEWKCLCEC